MIRLTWLLYAFCQLASIQIAGTLRAYRAPAAPTYQASTQSSLIPTAFPTLLAMADETKTQNTQQPPESIVAQNSEKRKRRSRSESRFYGHDLTNTT